MAYKIGFCPCCDAQTMVQDIHGRWNSFKSNFAQADLEFDSGQKVRTLLCKDCLGEPDLEKLMGAIVCSNSEACSDKTKDRIKVLGTPVKITEFILGKKGA